MQTMLTCKLYRSGLVHLTSHALVLMHDWLQYMYSFAFILRMLHIAGYVMFAVFDCPRSRADRQFQ